MKKLLVLLILSLFAYSLYRISLRPVDSSNDSRVSVTIEKGMSTRGIAKFLKEKGEIRSSMAFVLYSKLHGVQGGLQAGSFVLKTSMRTPDVIEALSKGFTDEVRITIPEGFTVKDIDALLVEKGITEPGEITKCAQTCDFSAFAFLPKPKGLAPRGGTIEGYLFPDTYFIRPDADASQKFLARLLATFETKVVKNLKEGIASSGRSLHQIVTMASLIEEETRADAERPVVAGILWKRLNGNIGLAVDATTRYILEKPTSAITKQDLEIDSPYNLRKYRGLPPGPIASPGLESIKAALHPETTDYLYYLHGTDGKIRYAKTNEEHNENRRKYLQ